MKYQIHTKDFVIDIGSITVLLGNSLEMTDKLIEKILLLEKCKDYSMADKDALYKIKFLLGEMNEYNRKILAEISEVVNKR